MEQGEGVGQAGGKGGEKPDEEERGTIVVVTVVVKSPRCTSQNPQQAGGP